MLPIIIGAVGLIAYGLFEENKKPKVAKKMAKGRNVKIYAVVDENTDRIYVKNSDKTFIDKKHKELKEIYPNDKLSIIEFPSKMAKGGNVNSEIDALYQKSGFINDDFNWELKLIEMLEDNSIEAYQIYQKLNSDQKESVLQELFSMNNDMGADGDGEIETSRENLQILLEDAKNGKKYGRGGKVVVRESNIDSDKKYKALKSGQRKSYKYANVEMRGGGYYSRRNANQYGKAKGGKTYTENRPNRTDKRIYLEKGGKI